MIKITSKEPVRAFLNELIGYFRTQEEGIRFMENGYDLTFMDWQGCGDGYGYSWLEPTYYTRKCRFRVSYRESTNEVWFGLIPHDCGSPITRDLYAFYHGEMLKVLLQHFYDRFEDLHVTNTFDEKFDKEWFQTENNNHKH